MFLIIYNVYPGKSSLNEISAVTDFWLELAGMLPKEKQLAVPSFISAGKVNWALILMTSFPHNPTFSVWPGYWVLF